MALITWDLKTWSERRFPSYHSNVGQKAFKLSAPSTWKGLQRELQQTDLSSKKCKSVVKSRVLYVNAVCQCFNYFDLITILTTKVPLGKINIYYLIVFNNLYCFQWYDMPPIL